MADSFDAFRLDETSYSPLRQLNYQKSVLLVVEDRDDIWILLRFALTKTFPDATIHRTSSRLETINYINGAVTAQDGLPKLILQDLYLPTKEDGLGLLRDSRALLADRQQIPIIVLSSSTDPHDIEQVYQSCGSYYIVKPTTIANWVSLCHSVRQFWWDQGVLPINSPGQLDSALIGGQ